MNKKKNNKRNKFIGTTLQNYFNEGWQGDLCDVPICRKGCDPMRGYCKRPGECRCSLGFYGDKCDRCIPLPGCQHGYCNVSFECLCNKVMLENVK